jgi:citrate lyase subunit gamma (acyl carrier protein)
VKIEKKTWAGTLESSDAYVEIEPSEGGIEVNVESVVKKQFGEKIKQAVLDVLQENQVENASVRITDRGALECVIKARVETAVMRGKGDN